MPAETTRQFETLAVYPFHSVGADGIVRPPKAKNLRAQHAQGIDYGVFSAATPDSEGTVAVVLSHRYSRSATVISISKAEVMDFVLAILEACGAACEAPIEPPAASGPPV